MPLLSDPVETLATEIKRLTADHAQEIKNLGRSNSETLEKIDRIDKAIDEIKARHEDVLKRADAIETRIHAARSMPDNQRLSETLLSASNFAKVISLDRGDKLDFKVSAKDILGLSPQMPQVLTEIAAGPRQTLRVRSLIPSTGTTSGAIQYLQETSFTNAANVVAEGQPKPKSDKTYVVQTRVIETIAHFFKVSKQSWSDLPALAAELEANLLYGLDLKVEQQLLKGTGVSPELTGMYPAAIPATAAPAQSTLIDTLFLAAAELSAKGYMPNGVVLSPADYSSMILLKDTTGRYLYGSTVPLPPIVVSPILTVGQWLIGDFQRCRLFVREEGNVQVASQHEDDFTKNLLTCLGEVRLALAIYQPAALIKNAGAVGREAETEPTARRR